MLRLSLLAALALSLAACDPVAGADDLGGGDATPPATTPFRIASATTEIWSVGTADWDLRHGSDYEYSSDGLLERVVRTGFNGASSSVTAYRYDALDRQAARVVEFDGSGFIQTYLYRYDGDSDRLAERRYGTDDEPFEQMNERELYTYDGLRRTRRAAETRVATGPWDRCQQSDYTYASGDELDQVVVRGRCFDDDVPLTQLILRDRYVYADARVQHVERDLRQAGVWVPADRYSYTYTAAGDLSVSLIEVYQDDGSFQPRFRTTYTYEDAADGSRTTPPSSFAGEPVDSPILANPLIP